MVLKSLSLSRIVGATSAPTFYRQAPILPHASTVLKQRPRSARGPGSRQRGAPPPGNLRERRPLHARLDLPPTPQHSATQRGTLQGDLTLWTLTFLKGVKGDRSRQKNTAKRVMGPESGPSTYLQQEQERGEAAVPGSHGWPGGRRANTELGCGRAGPG